MDQIAECANYGFCFLIPSFQNMRLPNFYRKPTLYLKVTFHLLSQNSYIIPRLVYILNSHQEGAI